MMRAFTEPGRTRRADLWGIYSKPPIILSDLVAKRFVVFRERARMQVVSKACPVLDTGDDRIR
jgi:hypothetical protein